MQESIQNSISTPPQRAGVLHSHSGLYLWIAAIIALTVGGLLLISIQIFQVEEEVNAIVADSLNFSGNRKPGNACKLPAEVSGNVVFTTWINTKGIEKDFCGGQQTPIRVDTQFPLRADAEQQCQSNVQEMGGGMLIISPNQQRSVCMGSFGEPDSDLWVYDKTENLEKRVLSCGTPCRYEQGFWIDDDRFVMLETQDVSGGGNLEYVTSLFNFEKGIVQVWKASQEWIMYRNEEYGFEFRYPAGYDEYGTTENTDSFSVSSGPNSSQYSIHVLVLKNEGLVSDFLARQDEFGLTGWEGQPAYEVLKEYKTKLLNGDATIREVRGLAADLFSIETYVNLNVDTILRITVRADNGNEVDTFLIQLNNQVISTFKFTK